MSIQDSITSAAGQIIGAGIAKSAEEMKKKQDEAKKQTAEIKQAQTTTIQQNKLMEDKLKEIATNVEDVSPYARINSILQGVHISTPLSNLVVNANKTMEYDPVYSQMATDRIEQGAAQRITQNDNLEKLLQLRKQGTPNSPVAKGVKYGK